MDLPVGQQTKKDFWTIHIQAAEQFEGTNKKYCEIHGLNLGSFNAYRNKLGYSKPRKKLKSSGFSQVQVTAERTKSNLPDPKWVAEFLKAWEAWQ